MSKEYDLVGGIIAYESGELDANGMLDLFAELIATDKVWYLQGSYGRRAHDLIMAGWIDDNGKVLKRSEV